MPVIVCVLRAASRAVLTPGLQPEFDVVGKRFELVPPDQGLKSVGMDFERRGVSAELFEREGAAVVGHRRSIRERVLPVGSECRFQRDLHLGQRRPVIVEYPA